MRHFGQMRVRINLLNGQSDLIFVSEMFRNLNPLSIRGIRNLRISQEEICSLAEATGFEGVDLNIIEINKMSKGKNVDEIKKLWFAKNLKPGGWRMPIKWREDETTFRKGLKDLQYYASIAGKLSCNRTYTWLLPFSDKLTFNQNMDWHIERLRPIAEILKKQGCNLGLEYVGTRTMRIGHKYEFIHDMTAMLRLIDNIGVNNIGLLLDSWHWHTSRETLDDLKKLNPKQIIYVHINDAPIAASIEELLDDDRRLPGETGVINLRGFLMSLHEIGYEGPITPECFNRELRRMSNLNATKATGKALIDLWSSLGWNVHAHNTC